MKVSLVLAVRGGNFSYMSCNSKIEMVSKIRDCDTPKGETKIYNMIIMNGIILLHLICMRMLKSLQIQKFRM